MGSLEVAVGVGAARDVDSARRLSQVRQADGDRAVSIRVGVHQATVLDIWRPDVRLRSHHADLLRDRRAGHPATVVSRSLPAVELTVVLPGGVGVETVRVGAVGAGEVRRVVVAVHAEPVSSAGARREGRVHAERAELHGDVTGDPHR